MVMAKTGCYICGTYSKPMILCKFCCAIEYCSIYHQLDDSDRHFRECRRILRTLKTTARIENDILDLRPVPEPGFEGHGVNLDDGQLYRLDITRTYTEYDENNNPKAPRTVPEPPYQDLKFKVFSDTNDPFNLDFSVVIDPHYNSTSNLYHYDNDAFDVEDSDSDACSYDPFKHRIHLINLFKPLDSSIYWTPLGKRYVAMRRHLLEAYFEVGTTTALETALKLSIDLHLMCRDSSDSTFVATTTAILYRLGMHEKCFNYLKDSSVNNFEAGLMGVDSQLFRLRILRNPQLIPRRCILLPQKREFPETRCLYLERPKNDHLIEQMFSDLLGREDFRNMHVQAQRQMRRYSAAKKWTLIYQDRLTEFESLGRERRVKSHYRFPDLVQDALLILMRFSCIQDIKNLQTFEVFSGWLESKLNYDVVHLIRDFIPNIEFTRQDKELLRDTDHATIIEQLEISIECMFKKNLSGSGSRLSSTLGFWKELIETIAIGAVHIRNSERMDAEQEKRYRALRAYWRLWRDTPGAIDTVKRWLSEFANFRESTHYRDSSAATLYFSLNT